MVYRTLHVGKTQVALSANIGNLVHGIELCILLHTKLYAMCMRQVWVFIPKLIYGVCFLVGSRVLPPYGVPIIGHHIFIMNCLDIEHDL